MVLTRFLGLISFSMRSLVLACKDLKNAPTIISGFGGIESFHQFQGLRRAISLRARKVL